MTGMKREREAENRFGDELREARMKHGLTIYKLAKISGVSRRHIVTAESGGNISILILTKLTRVLGLSEITVSDGLRVRFGGASQSVAPESLRSVLDDVERSVAHAQNAARTLQAMTPRVGKSIHVDTPRDDEINERAAALIGDFTEHVRRSLRDPRKLAEIGEAVSGLIRSEPSKGEAARAPAARRKRRTA